MTATAVPATALSGAGERMHALARSCSRSAAASQATACGTTLREIARRIPLEIHEVPSGTQVLDWTVPDEWNIRDAYIATPDGKRVVDFRDSNLHVVGYSEPVRATMTLDELEPHLHTASRESRPGSRIAPRTTTRTWGFCLSAQQLDSARRGSVRSRDRQHPRARLAHVRRVLPPG